MPTALVFEIDAITYGQNTSLHFVGHPSAVPYNATLTYDPSGDIDGDGNMDGDGVDGNYGNDLTSDTFMIDLGDGNGLQEAIVEFTMDPNTPQHGEVLVFTVNGVHYGLNMGGGKSGDVWGGPVSTGNQNNGQQVTDVGVMCFVRGSMITCPDGAVAIENLQAGDIVSTVSNGPQTLRWVGSTKRSANRGIAPIRIKAGALGKNIPSQDLLVSPAHRMLISGWRSELLFGEPEALVAAKELVNDDTITVAGDLVEFEYFHILFDNHEIVMSNGAPSESFQLNAEEFDTMEQAVRDEILELFPDLIASGNHNISVRPTISKAEATLLL